MEKYVVIMAGGSGTRLWPLSRETRPKQFICIDDGNCMLVQTIERMCEIVPADKCFIITNKNLQNITRSTVKDLIPYSNIILEPEKKNTAACIALATSILKERFGEGLVCFVPADGYVKDHKAYKDAIELAYITAERTKDLVIIGITPTYPATGYGYIEVNNDIDAQRISSVLKFIEKPDLQTAKKLVSSGDFLWNGGVLVGSIAAILNSIKTFLPEHENKISEAVKHADEEDGTTYIEDAYTEIQNISFDNGVLEKNDSTHVVSGLFDWDDIGSIDALSKTLNSDADGNVIKGKYLGIDTSNSVIVSGEDTLIATIGIDNMIIASTKDAILVCPRNKAQDIKTLVEMLKINGYTNLL
jgi:mannose-1-phosphate guanylyltransferase